MSDKPREFMLYDGNTENEKLCQFKGQPIAYAEIVHLIEYSAYESLEKRVKELEAENEELKRENLSLEIGWQTEAEKFESEIYRLGKAIAELEEAADSSTSQNSMTLDKK